MEEDYHSRPIQPMKCPRCMQPVIFEDNDRIVCKTCGPLYFDNWLGIWRIQVDEIEED